MTLVGRRAGSSRFGGGDGRIRIADRGFVDDDQGPLVGLPRVAASSNQLGRGRRRGLRSAVIRGFGCQLGFLCRTAGSRRHGSSATERGTSRLRKGLGLRWDNVRPNV